MAEDLLRDALIDAVAHAEGLPSLAEGMEMDRAAERINALDARPLEIAAEQIVGRPPKPEDGFAEHVGFVALGSPRLQFRDDLRPKRHRPLVLVLRRAFAEQRIRLRLVQVEIAPHQRSHLALSLPGVEEHLVGKPTAPSDREQPPQFVFGECTRRSHLLSARLDVRHLRERIHHQPVGLDEPVQERVRGEMKFLFRFRRELETRAPFHEGVRPDIAEHPPAVFVDHSPHALGRVANVLLAEFAPAQVGLVIVDEFGELRPGRNAHRLRRDDAFGLPLFFDHDVAKPFSRDLAVRCIEAHGDNLPAFVDRVAAAEHARDDALSVHEPRGSENEFDHDCTSEYLTADASRNRCNSLGRILGVRSLTFTKATRPPSTSRRNCRSEIPSTRAASAKFSNASTAPASPAFRFVFDFSAALARDPMSSRCDSRGQT
ncbi:MAG TPA: hypothetical protein VHE13_01135 [Opitutus sp.]|nr:hypothetical protein [Opitutus sp.]